MAVTYSLALITGVPTLLLTDMGIIGRLHTHSPWLPVYLHSALTWALPTLFTDMGITYTTH